MKPKHHIVVQPLSTFPRREHTQSYSVRKETLSCLYTCESLAFDRESYGNG